MAPIFCLHRHLSANTDTRWAGFFSWIFFSILLYYVHSLTIKAPWLNLPAKITKGNQLLICFLREIIICKCLACFGVKVWTFLPQVFSFAINIYIVPQHQLSALNYRMLLGLVAGLLWGTRFTVFKRVFKTPLALRYNWGKWMCLW